MRDDFGKAVERVRAGSATFAEFELATRERWRATARWLLHRTACPEWVEPQDVVQDLLAGAWSAIWGYCPDRGSMPLERYVRVAAVNEAKRQLNRARGVDRHTRVGPSHIDLTFARLGEEGEAALLNAYGAEPEQEQVLDRKRRMATMCRSLEELIVLQALDLERTFLGAARRVLSNEGARVILGITNETDAAVAVVRVAYGIEHRNSVETAA